MAMTNRANIKRDGLIMSTLDDLVPQDHLVRKMEEALDFRFIYPKVQHLYSRHGRPSIDPVVLFKMLIINIVFGINSMRKTCQEIEVNLAYRWFLGLSIDEKIPNFSTWSQNYIRRYKDSTIFKEIFMEILEQAVDYGFVDFTTVFGDSTHQKANANKRKSVKKGLQIPRKRAILLSDPMVLVCSCLYAQRPAAVSPVRSTTSSMQQCSPREARYSTCHSLLHHQRSQGLMMLTASFGTASLTSPSCPESS